MIPRTKCDGAGIVKLMLQKTRECFCIRGKRTITVAPPWRLVKLDGFGHYPATNFDLHKPKRTRLLVEPLLSPGHVIDGTASIMFQCQSRHEKESK